MPVKPLLKLAGALAIAAVAVSGLATPPAHAFLRHDHLHLFRRRPMHLQLHTGLETCTGSLTGTVRTAGQCSVC